ncbi:PAS domain S-box protein [Methylogaea oryzae]|uniref:PAS domain S-box protein n=1 Tax=Methylogaea oryzae TaxID=1295382 RepID=UPI0006D2A484|nr:PAS domain S-box protein [Methylogaea oryzae]
MKKRLPLHLVLLILLVPLIGVIFVVVQTPKMERDAYRNLESILALKAARIESWLQERQGDSESLSGSENLALRVEQLIQHKNDPLNRRLLSNRLHLLLRSYGYLSALLVDTQGNLLIGSGNHRDIPPLVRDLLRQTVDSKQVLHTDLYREETGHTHMDWIAPILAKTPTGERVIAAIVLRINLKSFLYETLQTWPTVSESAGSVLVRRDGNDVLFLSETHHIANAPLQFRRPVDTPALPAAAAVLADQPGIMRGWDFRGVEVLSAYRPIAGTPWRIVGKIDRAEVLAPMWNTLLWIGGVVFAAVVVILIVLYRLLRQQDYAHALEVEAEKLKADQLLRNFYELPFIGMAITSAETKRWIRFNDRLCEILGYSVEELLGKTWEEMTHPEDVSADLESFDSLLRGEHDDYSLEKRFIRKDGAVVYTLIDVRCVRKQDGRADFIVATVQDISERKRAEIRSERLKSLYENLVKINETLLHSTDDKQLFEELCRIPVDNGLMSMAWVGSEDPETRRIHPTFRYGYGTPYLDTIVISSRADLPEGRGTTGTAFREQKAIATNDWRTDPAMAPWKAQAAQYGWKSSACFPIFRNKKIHAIFTVYNQEPNFFDEQVMALLTALAGDVSYALDGMDIRRALMESEEHSKLLLESANSGIVGLDVQGNITFVNKTAADMLGRSAEELLTQPMHATAHHSRPDGTPFPEEECPLYATFMDGQPRHFAKGIFWRKNNSNFPVECWTHPIVRRNELLGAVVVFQDISERLIIEEQVNSERERLRNIIDATGAGTWEWNLSTGKAIFNERWAEIFGYTLAELVPFTTKSWEKFVHPDDLQLANERLQKHLYGKSDYYECDVRMRHKDGHWVWIADRGRITRRANDGSPLIVSGTHLDITERRQAQERLFQSEERFRKLFADSKQPLMLIEDGHFIDANPATLEMIGFDSVDEFRGISPAAISPEYQPTASRPPPKRKKCSASPRKKAATVSNGNISRKTASISSPKSCSRRSASPGKR